MTPGNYTPLNWRRTCTSVPCVLLWFLQARAQWRLGEHRRWWGLVLLLLVVVPSYGAFSIMREPLCPSPVSACLRLGRASCVPAERNGGPRAASAPFPSPSRPPGYGCGLWLWDVSLVRCGAPPPPPPLPRRRRPPGTPGNSPGVLRRPPRTRTRNGTRTRLPSPSTALRRLSGADTVSLSPSGFAHSSRSLNLIRSFLNFICFWLLSRSPSITLEHTRCLHRCRACHVFALLWVKHLETCFQIL